MAKRGTLYIEGTATRLSFSDFLTVSSESHSFANEVVSQTLEDGSSLCDHVVVQQDELEVQLFCSNSIPQGSQGVYSALKKMRNNRELCKIYTDHEIYDKMVIESVEAPHEAPMVNDMKFTVKFKRIDTVSVYANKNLPQQFQGVKNSVDMTACSVNDRGELPGQEVEVPEDFETFQKIIKEW